MTPPTRYRLLSAKIAAYTWIFRITVIFRSNWCVGAVMTVPYIGVSYRSVYLQFETP